MLCLGLAGVGVGISPKPSPSPKPSSASPACKCPFAGSPACGSDGHTYPSPCEALCAGATLLALAPCEAKALAAQLARNKDRSCNEAFSDPVCGTSERKTYGSICRAHLAGEMLRLGHA